MLHVVYYHCFFQCLKALKIKASKNILWLFDRKGATSKEQHWIHCLPLSSFAALALGCVHATCCCRSVPNTSFAWASESHCMKRQRSRLDSNRQKKTDYNEPDIWRSSTLHVILYIYIVYKWVYLYMYISTWWLCLFLQWLKAKLMTKHTPHI